MDFRFAAFVAIAITVPGLNGAAAAQQARTTTVRGMVIFPNGRPATGAVVTLSHPRMGTLTDASGAFELVGVPPGTNSLSVFALRTEPSTQRVAVGPDGLAVELQTGPEAPLVAHEIAPRASLHERRLQFSTSFETDEVFGERVGLGANGIEAFLNGPLPRGFTFNVGGTMVGQRSPAVGKGSADVATYVYDRPRNLVEYPTFGGSGELVSELPGFIQYGGDCEPAANLDWMGNPQACHGQRFPGNWTSALEFEGRVGWTQGGTTISYDRNARLDQSMVTSPFLFQSTGGIRSEARTSAFRFRHRTESASGGALTIQFDFTRLNDDGVSGRIDPEFTWSFRHADPPLGIETSRMPFEVSPDRFSYDTGPGAVTTLLTDADWDQLVLNTRTNTGTLVPLQDLLGLNRNPIPNWNPFGVTASFPATGTDWGGTIDQRRHNRTRVDAEWSPSTTHRLRFGISRESARIRRFSSSSYTRLIGPADDIYTGTPLTTEVFSYYRLVAGSALLEVGLSWYGFDSKAMFPNVPGRIFTHPDFDPTNPTSPDVWTLAERRTGIAPTARFSFATPNGHTAARISYEEQLTPPDFDMMMSGANHDFANVSTATMFGRDVGFDKAVQMEAGLRRVLGSWLVIDIAGFRRTRPREAAFRITQIRDPFTDRDNNVNTLTQTNFRTNTGVSLEVRIRLSNFLRTDLEYTHTGVEAGQSTDGFGNTVPAPFLDIPDTFSANWALVIPEGTSPSLLENFGIYGTALLRAGERYTRVTNLGQGGLTSSPGNISYAQEPLNQSSLPWTKQVNLRITRSFQAGRVGWIVFASVSNLLNAGNVRALFNETGELENEAFFRAVFYEPQINILRNEAQASGLLTTADHNGDVISAVDFRGDCSVWQGGGGEIGCLMLIQAERRFGNGDGIYDFVEFESAIRTWYNWVYGPETLLGPGRRFSIGVQLDF